MSERTWSNISGELKLTLYRDGHELYDDADNEAPECLLPYVQDDDSTYELVIDFVSSGYQRDADMYGGPDNVGSPAEGEDDRNPEYVCVFFTYSECVDTTLPVTKYSFVKKTLKVELPKKVQDEVFGWYREAIQDVEIETGD